MSSIDDHIIIKFNGRKNGISWHMRWIFQPICCTKDNKAINLEQDALNVWLLYGITLNRANIDLSYS